MIDQIKKKLGLRYNEKLWGRPSKVTRELFSEKRVLEHECYDEHFTGKAILMMPLTLVINNLCGEIEVPEYHANRFLEDGKVKAIKVLGEYRLVAPIFYHDEFGAVFGDELIKDICEAKNIRRVIYEN